MMSDVLEKLLPKVCEVIAGRYRVDSVLGEGGFGLVFAATQENLNRQVAIKMLLPHALTDSMAVNRFQREVDLARRLEHPNTVRIYDRGQTTTGLQYYVMEYINGPTLGDLINDQGPLTQARVKRIAEQVLGSLGEAHGLGFAHRDLKPANIMITEVFGEADFVKVLDFGISKNFAGEQTSAQPATVGLIGTPYYMSPEQASGHANIDGRSDLYALGLIMNEMLTGNKTYEGPSPLAILMAQLDRAPVPVPPEVAHSSLGPVVMRAVEKNPDTRFSSAQDMLQTLRGVQAHSVALQGVRTDWSNQGGAPPPSQPINTPLSHNFQSGTMNTGPSAAPHPPPPAPSGAGWSPHSQTMNRPGPERKGVSMGLVAVLVFLLVSMLGATATFFIVSGRTEGGSDTSQNDNDAGIQEDLEDSDTAVAGGDVSPDEAGVEEDTHVALNRDLGGPVPTTSDQLLVQGNALLGAGEWEGAVQAFQQVPGSAEEYAQAQANIRVARAGIQQRALYDEITSADGRGDYEAVRQALEQLPPGSFYRNRVLQDGVEARMAAHFEASQQEPDMGSTDSGTPDGPVVVHITGRPRRASVSLNRERVCRLPCDLELPPGEGPVDLRISKTDHCSETLTVERNHGQTYEVRLRAGCYNSIIP